MTRIGDSISWQTEGESVAEVVEHDAPTPSNDRIHLMHAINLYRVDSAGLGPVQEQTIDSMRDAAACAVSDPRGIVVDFVAIHSPEDATLIPESFETAPPLTRDARDVVTGSTGRPFPLVLDLLAHADRCGSQAEYVVFTNSDICLMPSFYFHPVYAPPGPVGGPAS